MIAIKSTKADEDSWIDGDTLIVYPYKTEVYNFKRKNRAPNYY